MHICMIFFESITHNDCFKCQFFPKNKKKHEEMNDTKTHTSFDSNVNLISSSQSENVSNGARRFGLSRFRK